MTEAAPKVKQQATKSVKWAFLGDVLPRVFQPLFSLILARLLTPTDYGIIGIATIVIGLASMVESMGLSQALIQTDEDIKKAADVVFWSNLGLSTLLYAVVFLGAPLIADFFSEPRAIWVLRVMGLQLVLSAFDDVQEALLRRNFQFKQLVGRRLIPALTPALVSIPLAIAGFGYWSLVAGSLSGTALGVMLLWKVSDWRPQFHFDVRIARLLLGFGALVAVESLQGWAMNYYDNSAVGYFLSSEDLGYYSFGYNLVMSTLGITVRPIASVAYSTFCRLQGLGEDLRSAFWDSNQMVAVVVIPCSLGLSLIASPFIKVVLGSKWSGAIPVIQILAVSPGLGWLWLLNGYLYKAMGRPDIMPKVHLAQLVYMTPAYWLAAQRDLITFCWIRASVIVFVVAHIWAIVRVLKVPASYLWTCTRSPLFAGLLMSGVVLTLVSLLDPYNSNWQGWISLAVIPASGAASYGLALWLIDRTLCLRFLRLARRVI